MIRLQPDAFLHGKSVKIINRGYYVQKKTSKNGLLNFIYKILFGKMFVYEIENGKIIYYGCLMMNPITFNALKEVENDDTN